MTSFLDKVSFLGAEVGQGTDLWRYSKAHRKTQLWHWRTPSTIPSPSLVIYLRCVELIGSTCCVPATTYRFPPSSWNSQCPAPTVYFSSAWGINLSVPREQTASFVWWVCHTMLLNFHIIVCKGLRNGNKAPPPWWLGAWVKLYRDCPSPFGGAQPFRVICL